MHAHTTFFFRSFVSDVWVVMPRNPLCNAITIAIQVSSVPGIFPLCFVGKLPVRRLNESANARTLAIESFGRPLRLQAPRFFANSFASDPPRVRFLAPVVSSCLCSPMTRVDLAPAGAACTPPPWCRLHHGSANVYWEECHACCCFRDGALVWDRTRGGA